MLFSPLIFCARGVAAAHAFYKSNRGGFDLLPPALAQKSSCLLFFLGSREPEASVASAFCFPLAAPSKKMAPTASSPEAKLVAMSSNWLVLVGVLRPSSCTNSLQVVSAMKALMTSKSVMLGSSVHCLENRLMKSWRDSSGFCRQLLRSQEFPGRTYVP